MGYQGNRINLIIDFIEKEMGVSVMMENWLHRLKRKQLSVVRWRLIWCRKRTIRRRKTTPALDVFWKGMQEKYSKQE